MKQAMYTLGAIALTLVAGGCSVRRDIGGAKPIGFYDYCVVSERQTGEYYDRASSLLGQTFVVLREDDPRLELPSVRQKTSIVAIDFAPGFWSTSGWVELRDWSGEEILRSSVRRGMFWAGADGDVMESLRDVAAARAAGPAVPPEARDPVEPMPVAGTSAVTGSRSKAQRLTELNELRMQGLVSDPEYSKQRAKIIEE